MDATLVASYMPFSLRGAEIAESVTAEIILRKPKLFSLGSWRGDQLPGSMFSKIYCTHQKRNRIVTITDAI